MKQRKNRKNNSKNGRVTSRPCIKNKVNRDNFDLSENLSVKDRNLKNLITALYYEKRAIPIKNSNKTIFGKNWDKFKYKPDSRYYKELIPILSYFDYILVQKYPLQISIICIKSIDSSYIIEDTLFDDLSEVLDNTKQLCNNDRNKKGKSYIQLLYSLEENINKTTYDKIETLNYNGGNRGKGKIKTIVIDHDRKRLTIPSFLINPPKIKSLIKSVMNKPKSEDEYREILSQSGLNPILAIFTTLLTFTISIILISPLSTKNYKLIELISTITFLLAIDISVKKREIIRDNRRQVILTSIFYSILFFGYRLYQGFDFNFIDIINIISIISITYFITDEYHEFQ